MRNMLNTEWKKSAATFSSSEFCRCSMHSKQEIEAHHNIVKILLVSPSAHCDTVSVRRRVQLTYTQVDTLVSLVHRY